MVKYVIVISVQYILSRCHCDICAVHMVKDDIVISVQYIRSNMSL